MRNTLFEDESLELLLDPGEWKIISSLFDEEVAFVHNQRHANWMSSHIDRHPVREVLFALGGDGFYGFKNRVYPCRPGTGFFFDSYEPHDNYYPPDCPRMLHLWLYIFENDMMARVINVEGSKLEQNWKQSVILSGTSPARLLNASWNELLAAPSLPAAFRRAKIISALSAFILDIVEQGYETVRQQNHGRAARREKDFQEEVVRTIQRHVAENAGRGVSLSEAARLAGYSKFHFLRLFKSLTGGTFHEYVNSCRLKKVEAMRQERRTQSEIADALGFSHASALLRWLKTVKKGDENSNASLL